ncbi:hypothetical protein GH733_005420 [Mirounga leonina]|nr:hypothetical protein GH733_005420 [Mirounga leonina]
MNWHFSWPVFYWRHMILTGKEKIVPKPEEEVAQKKKNPEESEETKTYGLGTNSAGSVKARNQS